MIDSTGNGKGSASRIFAEGCEHERRIIAACQTLMIEAYFGAYGADPWKERNERQAMIRAVSDRMLGYSRDYEVPT